MHVVTIEVPHLGNRSHLVHDGRVGVVIDPPRDLAPVETAAAEAGVDIVAVAETHIHNDYVSGGLVPLQAARSGVPRRGRRGGGLRPDRRPRQRDPGLRRHRPARHRDPGPHAAPRRPTWPPTRRRSATRRERCSAAAACCTARRAHRPGRPGPDDGPDPGAVAARRGGSGRCPPRPTLHPTHGFGGFCASSPGAGCRRRESTIGEPAQRQPGADQPRATPSSSQLLDGTRPGAEPLRPHGPAQPARRLDPAPRHSARRQPGRARPSPAEPRSSTSAAARRTPQGTCPAPSRSRPARTCAVYAGWVTPWGSELVLVSDSEDELDLAGARARVHRHRGRRRRVVLERHGSGHAWTGLRRTDWAGFAAEPPGPTAVVLDVRRPEEWRAGHLAHVAATSPCTSCRSRLEEIPRGRGLGALRGRLPGPVAAGLLDRAGATSCWSTTTSRGCAEIGIPVAARPIRCLSA